MKVDAAAEAVVAELVSRVQGDLDQIWSLDTLAETAGYSPAHLSRCFLAVVGQSPIHYLRQLRLERAAHHLEEFPEWSITEVALRAGYSAPEAFSRAFRRAFGLAPARFRQALPEAPRGTPRRQRWLPTAAVPPGLEPEPELVRLGTLRGWSLTIDSPAPAVMAAALAALRDVGPPPPPLTLGGLTQPWGWSSRTFRIEIRMFRLIDAPPPPGLQAWRVRARWWAQFDYSGPPMAMGPACQWTIEQWAPQSGLRVAFAPLLSLIGGPDSGRILLPITTLRGDLPG